MYVDCKKLRSEMGRAGFTTDQLAKAAGISCSTIKHYGDNGYKNIPAAILSKITKALDIKDSDILVDRVELIGRCAEIRLKLRQVESQNLEFERTAYQEEIDRMEAVIRKMA